MSAGGYGSPSEQARELHRNFVDGYAAGLAQARKVLHPEDAAVQVDAAELRAVIDDLDVARAEGRLFTYGQIQARLRALVPGDVPGDIKAAEQKLAEATLALEQITALPREIGSRVRWSNGVVWTRAGDNDWRSGYLEIPYRSAHIASSPWTLVESGEPTA